MIFRFRQFSVDTSKYQIFDGMAEVAVEPQAFDLLVHLIRNNDRVVTHDEMLSELWRNKVVSESALTVQIKKIRRAIGDSGKHQKFIKTVSGRGYQFVESVQCSDSANISTVATESSNSQLTTPIIAVQEFKYIGKDSSNASLVTAITGELRSGLSK